MKRSNGGKKLMKEKKKESTIILVIALALVCVCVAAVIGINAIIRNSKVAEPEVIDTLAPPEENLVEIEVPEIATDEEISINIDFNSEAGSQEIQEAAEIPDAPEQPEPIGDITDPETPPTYDLPPLEEEPTQPQVTPSDPIPGGEPGQVYVPGFGWVTPSGGVTIPAPDLAPNGNIIGSM